MTELLLEEKEGNKGQWKGIESDGPDFVDGIIQLEDAPDCSTIHWEVGGDERSFMIKRPKKTRRPTTFKSSLDLYYSSDFKDAFAISEKWTAIFYWKLLRRIALKMLDFFFFPISWIPRILHGQTFRSSIFPPFFLTLDRCHACFFCLFVFFPLH
jgi:hypothetical protein